MSTRDAVLVVARDAGAAAALAPVVDTLPAHAGLHPVVVAWGNAAAVFGEHGQAVREFSFEPDPREIVALLDELAAAAVLTGTSLRVELDGRFWSAAREARIPSVALLDHWKNYAERFSLELPFDTLPTVVAVMDDVAADELARRGCPPERIRVTGQPRFDALAAVDATELRRGARERLGIEETRRVVVFASEPRGAPWDDGTDVTQHEALGLLLDELAVSAPEALVLVKLHPVEPNAPEPREGGPEVRVLRDWPIPELAAATDLFVGMTSIVLLDAALLGAPTLSIRRRDAPSQFVDLHADLISTVTSRAELRRGIENALAHGRRRVASNVVPGAAQRVCRLVAELAGGAAIMPA